MSAVERRRRLPAGAADAARTIAQQLLAVLIALVIAGVVVEVSGFNAFDVASSMGSAYGSDILGTLRWTAPLILTGLATCVAFRGRVYNIGFDGQLYVGAAATAVLGLKVLDGVPPVLAIPLMLAGGTLAGAAWAGLAGFLRVRWGAPEIITTVILIDVARLLVQYLVLGPLTGAGGLGSAQSTDIIKPSLWLPGLGAQSQASISLYVALAAVAVVSVYLFRSRRGYELKLFGQNPRFTFYGGVENPRVYMRAMLISGGLSGLAGGTEVLGVLHRLPSSFASGLGFQGIAVSLVANNNPIGILFSGFFFGGLRTGGISLQVNTDTPAQIVDVVSAIVILVITAKVGQVLIRKRGRRAAESATGIT